MPPPAPQPRLLPLTPSYPSPAQVVSPLAYVASHAAPLQPSTPHAAAAATGGGGGAAGGDAGGGAATSVPPSILTSSLTLYRDELPTEPVSLRACSPEHELREGPVPPHGSSHPHAYAHSPQPLLSLQPLRQSLPRRRSAHASQGHACIAGAQAQRTAADPDLGPQVLASYHPSRSMVKCSQCACDGMRMWCACRHVTCTVLTSWLPPPRPTPPTAHPPRQERSCCARGRELTADTAARAPAERASGQARALPQRPRCRRLVGGQVRLYLPYISPISPLYIPYISPISRLVGGQVRPSRHDAPPAPAPTQLHPTPLPCARAPVPHASTSPLTHPKPRPTRPRPPHPAPAPAPSSSRPPPHLIQASVLRHALTNSEL